MLKKLFLAVLAMSMAGAMMAQTSFSLHGSLKDSKGEPMMFSNCVLLKQADSLKAQRLDAEKAALKAYEEEQKAAKAAPAPKADAKPEAKPKAEAKNAK